MSRSPSSVGLVSSVRVSSLNEANASSPTCARSSSSEIAFTLSTDGITSLSITRVIPGTSGCSNAGSQVPMSPGVYSGVPSGFSTCSTAVNSRLGLPLKDRVPCLRPGILANKPLSTVSRFSAILSSTLSLPLLIASWSSCTLRMLMPSTSNRSIILTKLPPCFSRAFRIRSAI